MPRNITWQQWRWARVVVAGSYSVLCEYSHLQKAEDLVKKAKEADSKECYEEALQLYDLAIDGFILALKGKHFSAMESKGLWFRVQYIIVQSDKAYSDKESVLVRANVNIYLERVEVLKKKKGCNTKDVMTREVREHGYMHSCNCSTVGLICLLIRRFESTSAAFMNKFSVKQCLKNRAVPCFWKELSRTGAGSST